MGDQHIHPGFLTIVGAILGTLAAILGNVGLCVLLGGLWSQKWSRALYVGGDRAVACWQNSCQQSIRIQNEIKMADQHLPPGFLMIVDAILRTFETISGHVDAMLALSWEDSAPKDWSRFPRVGGDHVVACLQNSCQQNIRIQNEPKKALFPKGSWWLNPSWAMLGASWRYLGRTWGSLGPPWRSQIKNGKRKTNVVKNVAGTSTSELFIKPCMLHSF